MKEEKEFYSIGRGSLNLNGKFYYGLDYAITDFMRSLEEENKSLQSQLKAKEEVEKEFIKYLEDNWKQTQDIWYIKILQKYRSIIGCDKVE